MEFSDLLKLLEGAKSPALLLLGYIAWQTFRTLSRLVDRIEEMAGSLRRIEAVAVPAAERIERMDTGIERIDDKVSALPLEMIRLRAAGTGR
jgi:hypothetical protein